MLWIGRQARLTGFTINSDGTVVRNWRCPNKNCKMSVAEGTILCPHCSQRLKFDLTDELGGLG